MPRQPNLDRFSDPEVLRKLLATALRERDNSKMNAARVAQAIRDAVLMAVQGLKVDAPKAQRPKPGRGAAEIAVIHASDWQLGKVTPTYNSAVCARRVKTFSQKVLRISEIQNADHPVREARLYLTGDHVEGEGIFATQAHVIDSGLYRQVGVNGPKILVELILDLLAWFDRVHVVGVIGNHGSVRIASGSTDPETNMDRLLYQVAKQILLGVEGRPTPAQAELAKRLTFNIPDGPGERNWFAVDRVFDWGFLLAHGDQIRGGFAGFPFYGYAKKAWGWIDAIAEPWDYLMTGHWHTPTSMTLNKRQVRVNGSTESDNTYAQENLAAAGHPTQFLAFVHPKHGMTSEYWVNLEDREAQLGRARRQGGLTA